MCLVVILYPFISYSFLPNTTAHLANVNLSLLYMNLLKGTVRLIFQPAEEGGAGAAHMIREGALGDAEAIFAMHVAPDLSTGTIVQSQGQFWLGSSIFEAVIEGKGGHAAMPHITADPVVATSFAILSLQQIVSRESDPLTVKYV
jgi:IAA-amino acid hydrolase